MKKGAAYPNSHVAVLGSLVLAELLLALLDSHILQEVCIPLGFWAFKAQLVEEGHHLNIASAVYSLV